MRVSCGTYAHTSTCSVWIRLWQAASFLHRLFFSCWSRSWIWSNCYIYIYVHLEQSSWFCAWAVHAVTHLKGGGHALGLWTLEEATVNSNTSRRNAVMWSCLLLECQDPLDLLQKSVYLFPWKACLATTYRCTNRKVKMIVGTASLPICDCTSQLLWHMFLCFWCG